jgi:hypothetical protein
LDESLLSIVKFCCKKFAPPGKLSDNSDDVANLIKNQLESIVSSTQLNPQAPPGVTVTVTPHCSGSQVSGIGPHYQVELFPRGLFSYFTKFNFSHVVYFPIFAKLNFPTWFIFLFLPSELSHVVYFSYFYQLNFPTWFIFLFLPS